MSSGRGGPGLHRWAAAAAALALLYGSAVWAAGPVQLAPGQTYRVPFSAPATFDFACSAHDEGQLTIVVEREPVPGWPRLRWRLTGLLGA
jgi:hypothetical protein